MVARESAKIVISQTATATRPATAKLWSNANVMPEKKRELKIEIRILIILVLHCKKRTSSARLTFACSMGPTKYCLIRCIFCAIVPSHIEKKTRHMCCIINIYSYIYYVNVNSRAILNQLPQNSLEFHVQDIHTLFVHLNPPNHFPYTSSARSTAWPRFSCRPSAHSAACASSDSAWRTGCR